MRIQLNTRLFKGTAVYEDYGDTGLLVYQSTVIPPLNSKYDIEGKIWRVSSVTASDYVEGVIKIGLEKV
jgi:hypothetical protein